MGLRASGFGFRVFGSFSVLLGFYRASYLLKARLGNIRNIDRFLTGFLLKDEGDQGDWDIAPLLWVWGLGCSLTRA